MTECWEQYKEQMSEKISLENGSEVETPEKRKHQKNAGLEDENQEAAFEKAWREEAARREAA